MDRSRIITILEDPDFLSRFGVPEPSRLVAASAEDALAVWAEGHGSDRQGMAPKDADFPARFGVQMCGRLVAASADDPLAVGADSQGGHVELAYRPARCNVPQQR